MARLVFLTGGSGVVGGALLRRLIADGREVRALARSERSAHAVEQAGAHAVRGDVFDHAALLAGMRGCGTVFHVAGVNRMCSRDPRPMLRANVDGAANVVRAASAARVGRLVHTSSATTIGEASGIVADEETPHRGSFLSAYERSKFLGERRVLSLGRELGLPVVCVNPSSVHGAGRTTGSATLLLDIVNGRLPVLVNTWVSVVDVDDCSAAHVLAEQEGVPGRRYLVSGASIDVRTAVALLRAVCGRPRHVWFVPRSVAKIGGAIAGVAATFTRGGARVCPEAVRTLLHGHRFDASRSERELGLRYTPVEETLRRTMAWYAARGLAPSPIG